MTLWSIMNVLIISANQSLEKEGKEPLYVVYPYDGPEYCRFPLGYVDHGKEKKEKAFLKIQDYLLSESVQNQIQRTGRRTGYGGVKEENKDIFNPGLGDRYRQDPFHHLPCLPPRSSPRL